MINSSSSLPPVYMLNDFLVEKILLELTEKEDLISVSQSNKSCHRVVTRPDFLDIWRTAKRNREEKILQGFSDSLANQIIPDQTQNDIAPPVPQAPQMPQMPAVNPFQVGLRMRAHRGCQTEIIQAAASGIFTIIENECHSFCFLNYNTVPVRVATYVSDKDDLRIPSWGHIVKDLMPGKWSVMARVILSAAGSPYRLDVLGAKLTPRLNEEPILVKGSSLFHNRFPIVVNPAPQNPAANGEIEENPDEPMYDDDEDVSN